MRGSEGASKIDKDVRRCIDSEDMERLFHRERLLAKVQSVDFFLGEHVSSADNGRYIIQVAKSFPPRSHRGELVCLFPQHPVPAARVLDAGTYYDICTFNAELNERFRVCVESGSGGGGQTGNVRFAVAYGDNVFWCKDIAGNIYVRWAQYINRVNAGNVANTVFTHAPLVIATNGARRITAMYVLRSERIRSPHELQLLPMKNNNPVLLLPRLPIWVCDSAPDAVPQPRVQSISEREAQALLTAPSKGPAAWLPYERNVFDTGASVANPSVLEDGLFDVCESPREVLQARVAPPALVVAVGAASKEPDPFASDEDDGNEEEAAAAALGDEGGSDGGYVI